MRPTAVMRTRHPRCNRSHASGRGRFRFYDRGMSDSFNTPSTVDPRLLEVLVCPVTRGTLSYDRARQELVSKGAKLAFPIRDGVPILLVGEARHLD